jgi:hypothetical protein
MPDPRLVSRAQRAATMLERAWERWRATQGLEAQPMPPVSSYVGYSIEEPWGRPRVVFGVNAEDAERLAALLQESAGYGPEDLPRPADSGYRPPVRGAFAADRPALPDRGYDQSLFDDVRGRIPVQGWPPEFSDSREQLNSAGPSRPDEPELPLDLGPVQDDEPGRVHDLKPPVELGLSDEFRPADDFLDADEFPAEDSRADDSRADGFPADGFRGDGFRGDQSGRDNESRAFGLDAPYGVPYAGEAPYGVPYTGEPYYPDGAYGTAGPGEYGTVGVDPAAGGYGAGVDPAAGGYGTAGANPAGGGYGTAGANPVAGGYGTAGVNPAAGGYGAPEVNPAAGGYGAAGPYRPADDLASEREEAAGHVSDGAPGTGERPERDGQPGQPAGPLAQEAPRAGAQEVTAATAGVPAEAVPAEDASRDVSGRNMSGRDESGQDGSGRDEDVRDGSGWNEDVPDESAPDEDVRDEDVRDESGDDEDLRAADLRAADARGGDARGGDARGAEVRPSDETPDRNGPAGRHMLAGGVPARKDDGGGDPLSRDAQPDQGPRPHGGPVPGPRHVSAPDGHDWPPPGSARLATAGPGQEPPAAAQPAEDVPGGPTASADRPADPASRGSITDTMAAELAGWAAGELPGQAAARLASWAAAGGAVARERQQTRIGGGGTAAERVS